MAKAWTPKEVKDCSLIYSDSGIQAAMKSTGRSRHSVLNKMKEINNTSTWKPMTRNLKSITRKLYAEDVAKMFEFSSSGLKASLIAEYFNTTANSIRSTMCLARKNGFDAYPLRNES